jgi:oligopeptide/dipeptide ABC transporter ATP-binding protein
MTGSGEVLRVEGLRTVFRTGRATRVAVDDVSFALGRGETLGLAGESGCGKSVTSLSLMRLVPSPPGTIESGRVILEGTDLLSLPEEEMRRVRGGRLAMIFQEPMTSLNPVFTVGRQVAEVFAVHSGIEGREARARVVDLLARVGLPDPARRCDEYPHQLSGGMRQRAMIAMALAGSPAVLIADEPTTALDVTIQAQILELVDGLRRELGMATLFITHDLGVIARTAQRAAVMYAGRIVETAPCRDLFGTPWHPYTSGLLDSLPSRNRGDGRGRLASIPGSVPDLADLPTGCPFHPRCARRRPVCRELLPPLEEKSPGHWARCLVAP